MTSAAPIATLPRRGRPPTIIRTAEKATVVVKGREITVPLTRTGNVSPSFVTASEGDEDVTYAIALVQRTPGS